jgi:hypothetical protein
MTANPEPGVTPERSRVLLRRRTRGTHICIDHVYEPGGEPGMVGLLLWDNDATVSVLLDAADALLVAERLQRAASLVLKFDEDPEDIEREAARYTATEATP